MSNKDILELVFKHSGGVELRAITAGRGQDEDGDTLDTVVWASDSDQDFQDRIGAELLDPEDDAERVMEYLVEADVIDDDEADDLRIVEESLDGRDIVDGDVDPGDEENDDDDYDEGARDRKRQGTANIGGGRN
jgi:hypothetical protein